MYLTVKVHIAKNKRHLVNLVHCQKYNKINALNDHTFTINIVE